jgi:hypothetical protein
MNDSAPHFHTHVQKDDCVIDWSLYPRTIITIFNILTLPDNYRVILAVTGSNDIVLCNIY